MVSDLTDGSPLGVMTGACADIVRVRRAPMQIAKRRRMAFLTPASVLLSQTLLANVWPLAGAVSSGARRPAGATSRNRALFSQAGPRAVRPLRSYPAPGHRSDWRASRSRGDGR